MNLVTITIMHIINLYNHKNLEYVITIFIKNKISDVSYIYLKSLLQHRKVNLYFYYVNSAFYTSIVYNLTYAIHIQYMYILRNITLGTSKYYLRLSLYIIPNYIFLYCI